MRNQNTKNILFCSSFIPPHNAGGGINAYRFANHLASEDYNVTLISLNRKGRYNCRERIGNLTIRRIFYANFNLFTKFLSLIIILPSYMFHILKNEVIFIYGSNIIAYEFIILFSRWMKKKVIFRSTMLYEDSPKALMNKCLWGSLVKYILKKIDFYFSINPIFTNEYLFYFKAPEKVFEFPQGVNNNIFFPVNQGTKKRIRQKLSLPQEIPIIISIGSVINRKGYNDLFNWMKDSNEDFFYIVIGDYRIQKGHFLYGLKDEMIELYKTGKQALGNQVLFTGSVENVHLYLQASDIFVLNSKQEGLPNSLLEAMSTGTIPLISDIPGLRDFLIRPNENGLIFYNRDTFIKHLAHLLVDAPFRIKLQKMASETINKNYTFNKVQEKMIEKGLLT